MTFLVETKIALIKPSDKAALVNPVTWAKLKAVLFCPTHSAIFGASGLFGVH